MIQDLSWYEKFKNWCKEHKKEIYVAVGFGLMFLVGFGTGKFNQPERVKSQSSANYSKPGAVEQKVLPEKPANPEAGIKPQVAGTAAEGRGAEAKAVCVIKGNIASTGSKIYHTKGGAFYERTNAEMCFNTEQEAIAAGFRKSSR